MKKTLQLLVLAIGLCIVSLSEAKTIRASDMNSGLWSQLAAGAASDLTVEFRQGDEIPVTVVSQGDFLETRQAGVTYVTVKKSFWVRFVNSNPQMSLDGTSFKPLSDLVTGSVQAGAETATNGGPVNAINLIFQMNSK